MFVFNNKPSKQHLVRGERRGERRGEWRGEEKIVETSEDRTELRGIRTEREKEGCGDAEGESKVEGEVSNS